MGAEHEAVFDAPIAQEATTAERAEFITKTYAHLAGAIAGMMALIWIFCQIPGVENVVQMMIGYQWSWAVVLIAFMVVSTIANRWALSATSLSTQYMGLGLYVFAEALILLPIIYIVSAMPNGPQTIMAAALTTGVTFAGLTVVVFVTRKDFSFLKGLLGLGMLIAMGLIFSSIFFGFHLGTIFSVAMVALMCGYILYYTSNVLHHYHIGQHVAAALALFAAVATLFWYILQLFLSSSD